MKHLYRFFIFQLVAFSLVIQFTYSASIMASGGILWTCIGHDSFLLKLQLYRDCNGQVLNNAIIKFYCLNNDSLISSLQITKPNGIDITPTCNNTCTRCSNPNCSFPFGVQQFTFTTLFVVPSVSCCQIKIKFQECCRNSALTNIDSNQSFYTESTMNRCLSPCDNSPTFTNPPVAIICLWENFVFNHGVSDIDLGSTGGLIDSLGYEWVQPMQNSVTPVTWISPYSYDKPIYFSGFPIATLPSPKGFHLDFSTGDIYFVPMKIEQTIMSLAVSEYRKGVKIGEVRREIQIIVMGCPKNHQPALASTYYYKEVCAGNTVSFSINTNDLDPHDSLCISWNHGIPGAKWTDNNPHTKHPTGTFTWEPGLSQTSSLPYSFVVTVKDDACPISGSYSRAFQVMVKPIPRAAITVIDSGSGNYWFKARTLQGAGPAFLWASPSFTFMPDSGTLVHSHINTPGKYPYHLTIMAQGCSQVYDDSLRADTTMLSINEKNHQISIYPNPTNNSVIIRTVDKNDMIKTIILSNNSGQQVQSYENVNSTEFILEKRSLKKGIYYLEIWLAGERMILRKVIFE